jgi:hypothetical protein
MGICEDPIGVLSEKVRLSVSTIRRHRKELARRRPELGNRALISIEERWGEDGSRLPDLITIADQDRLADIYEELK